MPILVSKLITLIKTEKKITYLNSPRVEKGHRNWFARVGNKVCSSSTGIPKVGIWLQMLDIDDFDHSNQSRDLLEASHFRYQNVFAFGDRAGAFCWIRSSDFEFDFS